MHPKENKQDISKEVQLKQKRNFTLGNNKGATPSQAKIKQVTKHK